MIFRLAPAVTLTALLVTPVFAQGGGGGMPQMPKPEEIERQAREFLSQAETKTAELEGFVKITYKAIPSSTEEIGKLVGEKYKDRIPKGSGVDIDAALKQYGPQIQEALNKYLTEPEGWKFEAVVDLKWKSKKIPKGEYKMSLEVDGEAVKTLILTQAETKDEKGKKIAAVAIPIHFKADKKQEEPFPKLKFDVKGIEDKKTKEVKTFDVYTEFFRTSAKTTEAMKLDPPKDTAKKTEPKKEDAPKKDEGK